MKAAVYRGAGQIEIEEVPVPVIGDGELLVRTAVCGVCPTDLKKIHHGLLPPPRIFGHEMAGTIVRVGRGVDGFVTGDRVALHHHVPCLDCHACRHRAFAQCPVYKRTGCTAGFEPAGGGFAEYVRVMPFVLPGVVRIPDENEFIEGALLEPVNTVLKGVKRLNLLPGDVVAVLGQGPIGLMFTGILSAHGARVLASDIVPERLQKAREFGARWTTNGDLQRAEPSIADLTGGRGLDAVIVAAPSNELVRSALRSVRGGGQVLLFAHTRRGDEIAVDPGQICADEKDLIGSYSSDFTSQSEVADLVFSRRLDVRGLVTHRFPLNSAAEAIALASRPGPASLKVAIEPANGGPS